MEPPVKTSLTPSVVPRVLVQISTKPRVFGSQPPRTPCNCLPLRAPNAHRVRTKSRRPLRTAARRGVRPVLRQKKCQGTTAWHVLWHPKNNEDPGSVVWSWRFARKTIGFDKPVMVNNDKNESWFLVLKPLGFLWLSNLDTLFDHWIVSTPAWVFWFSTPNRSKNKIHHLAI